MAGRGAAAAEAAVLNELSAEHYQRLAVVLNGRLGIMLPPSKRGMLEMRLRPRLRELGCPDFHQYCRYVFSGALADEMQHLIDAVTTNKTDFFREAEHFEALRTVVLPRLLAQREGEPLLKLWSAAASTGAEAYSIAMVLEEVLRVSRAFRYAVLGTDVSARVIATATEGIYASETVATIPAALKSRYMLSSIYGGTGAAMRVASELRRKVSFCLLNLMDKTYPVDRDVDVIFLRNVLIYFEPADQRAVIGRLLGHLSSAGVLILGHSEAAIGASMGLEQIAQGVFLKPS